MTTNINKKPYKNLSLENNADNSFSLSKAVKKPYSQGLKIRLRTLIKDREMKESDFYKKVGLSRNYWYLISYGRIECPLEIKIKIARALNTDSALIFQKGEGSQSPSPSSMLNKEDQNEL